MLDHLKNSFKATLWSILHVQNPPTSNQMDNSNQMDVPPPAQFFRAKGNTKILYFNSIETPQSFRQLDAVMNSTDEILTSNVEQKPTFFKYSLKIIGNMTRCLPQVAVATVDIVNWPRDNWPLAESWILDKAARVCRCVKSCFDSSVNLANRAIDQIGHLAFKVISTTLDIVNWPRDNWPLAESLMLKV